ncbi:MAG: T9SS type A sorting domain-containing protein [Bacteroidales bacterium]|nr:T9SS type A sorting domain-containing protein [Bacteroidales bacterium]
MKNKVLPFNLLVLFASVLLVSFTVKSDNGEGKSERNAAADAVNYLTTLRNNQHSGKLPIADVIKAQQQIASSSNRDSYELDWKAIGPDNFAGRTRAFIFDNQDPEHKTLITGAVTGGLWKSTNAGLSWNKINGTQNLFVSCMVQADDGTIYVGTGEYYHANDFSHFGEMGYSGGLAGSGIYKSTDGENFSLLESTKPSPNDDEDSWAFINQIDIDNNTGRLYAATNNGLKYSEDGGATWMNPTIAIDSAAYMINASITIVCDSFEVNGDEITYYNADTTDFTMDTIAEESSRVTTPMQEEMCQDVQVASDGSVITNVGGYTFVYNDNEFVFKNTASYPENIYFIVEDAIDYSISASANDGSDTSYTFNVVNPYAPYKGGNQSLPNPEASAVGIYLGSMKYAIAPSDPNVMYASAIKDIEGSLINIYVSEDKGNTCRIILPGENNSIDIYGQYGMYSNAMRVHPNQPGKILVGANQVWEGEKFHPEGYYQWEQRSSQVFPPTFNLYVHAGHHDYIFHPSNNNEFVIATSGGLYYGLISGSTYEFEPIKKSLITGQFYTVNPSGIKKYVVGGAQDNGVIAIDGEGNTPKTGKQVYELIEDALYLYNGSGGYSQISKIDPAVAVISRNATGARFKRTDDYFESFSISTFMGNDTSLIQSTFLVPTLLWESFDDQNSRDSVYFHADKEYAQGDVIQVQSNNRGYPFYTTLEEALLPGDSLQVQDKVQSKFFMGVRDHIFMSLTVLDFGRNVVWWEIANDDYTEFTGVPSCMASSDDANQLYVGTQDGHLYRMSNIATAFTEETADCSSDKCIISTKMIPIIDPATGEQNTQAITSISVDPQNPQKLIVTMANYGNDNYVYRTDNALDSIPDFNSIQGDLPKMPVYASLIEMSEDNDLVLIGTEHGVYTSENTSTTNPSWTPAKLNMSDVPVMMLTQQTIKKLPDYVPIPQGSDTIWEEYAGTNNYGVIYAATYGRGLFRSDKYQKPVDIEENEFTPLAGDVSIDIYPNPAISNAMITFELTKATSTEISIYNINGKMLDHISLGQKTSGKHEVNYNISSLPEGMYFIRIQAGNSLSTAKFMVVK